MPDYKIMEEDADYNCIETGPVFYSPGQTGRIYTLEMDIKRGGSFKIDKGATIKLTEDKIFVTTGGEVEYDPEETTGP